jgi:hypothetical protein
MSAPAPAPTMANVFNDDGKYLGVVSLEAESASKHSTPPSAALAYGEALFRLRRSFQQEPEAA